MSALQFIESSS